MLQEMPQVLALLVSEAGGGLSLPQWLLELSVLLAGAVVISIIARRAKLPLTAVLVVVGFVVS